MTELLDTSKKFPSPHMLNSWGAGRCPTDAILTSPPDVIRRRDVHSAGSVACDPTDTSMLAIRVSNERPWALVAAERLACRASEKTLSSFTLSTVGASCSCFRTDFTAHVAERYWDRRRSL